MNTQLTATQVNRVTDKSGKFLGYTVASRSGNEPHYITWNSDVSRWECTCKAGQHGQKCHAVKAVNESILARRVLANKPAERPISERGNLNGTREFSLLR